MDHAYLLLNMYEGAALEQVDIGEPLINFAINMEKFDIAAHMISNCRALELDNEKGCAQILHKAFLQAKD